MLNIKYTSGCLKVLSNDFEATYKSILDIVMSFAVEEWNKFDHWTSSRGEWERSTDKFEKYYELDKLEQQLYFSKSSMPDSFIEKYYNIQLNKNSHYFLMQLSIVLWHKKNPDTAANSIDGLKNHKMYKVKCKICNNIYFMDEESICCVKWRSCIGVKCLSTTISNEESPYHNLCTVKNESAALKILDTQLSYIENISKPLSCYGGYSNLSNSNLNISYISDMHLLHHSYENMVNIKSLIHNTIKRLYATMYNQGIIVFAGDISSDKNVTIKFYEDFVKYKDYLGYLNIKKSLHEFKELESTIEVLEFKINKLSVYIENFISKINEYIDFNIIKRYKDCYRIYDSWVDTFEFFKKTKSYINKKVPKQCESYLEFIAPKLDILDDFKKRHSRAMERYNKNKEAFHDIECLHKKDVKYLTISEVYKEHYLLSDERQIFVVLGNHEYVGFDSVKDAVAFYDEKLGYLGIKLLHNNYFDFNIGDKHGVIFGGTGFAKYNLKYNAGTVPCCNNFTRNDEISETTIFEKAYLEAKQVAIDRKACFICVSHYPIQDCYPIVDKDTIYFYGHNHQNYYHCNENEMIYADNQIGYKNPNIEFKVMRTGIEPNPYFTLEDGLYKTTISDYLQFYRYLGESVGEGAVLYQRCQYDRAGLYVIKRKGYYGFFIMNLQGISIVNGGQTKKITKSKNLQWLFDNFEIVLSKYLQALAPLRLAQEQISKELRDLSFSGKIHGCIVDIDYYHHIMLNPVDGTMTFYFSPSFGSVLTLVSFDEVLKSISKNDVGLFSTNRDYGLLQRKFEQAKRNDNYLLGKINESYELNSNNSDKLDSNEQVVSRSEGMYGISRNVSPLQRLFSCHTLRVFDINLVETQPELENNDKSINNSK